MGGGVSLVYCSMAKMENNKKEEKNEKEIGADPIILFCLG